MSTIELWFDLMKKENVKMVSLLSRNKGKIKKINNL